MTGVFGDKVGAAVIGGAGVVVACVRTQFDAAIHHLLRHQADRFEYRGLVGAQGALAICVDGHLIGQARGDFVDALVFSGFGDFLEDHAQFVAVHLVAANVYSGYGIDGSDVLGF